MKNWVPLMEDYDSRILEMLTQIKVDLNGDGELVPIHVTYFSPEPEGEEDRDSLRPAVVLYMYDEVHDIKREHSNPLHMISDTETDITLKGEPTPVKFFYQFNILTDYQQHMNEILRQFNQLFPRRGFITLKDPSGEEVDYDFFFRSADNGYTKQFLDFAANEQLRTFRKIYRYVLHAEVDESQSQTFKKVHELEHNAENTNP